MWYMGGKHRQGPAIANLVGRVAGSREHYYEPFCGAMGSACAVITHCARASTRVRRFSLSDANAYVMRMWVEAVAGWEPPISASEDIYQQLKKHKPIDDPLTAFYGYGLSFGAKWFGGYARGARGLRDDQRYVKSARDSVLRRAAILRDAGAALYTRDYSQVMPSGAVVYLDPPYAGRTKAHGVHFDHGAFYHYARCLLDNDNVVLLTEFTAPPDFVRVYNWGDTVVRHHMGLPSDGTNESIFMHKSQTHLAGDMGDA